VSTSREAVTITPYPDGPLLVRGEIELRTAEGEIIEPQRRTVALCRCGLSAIKPFCDGTHKAANFRTDDELTRPRTDG
jgi:CDGSH-type Zn-finger protein